MSVVEQRYHAVMEVAAGVPVTQVAARYGVSRQSVHSWVRKYEQSGLPGLADRSHRPESCPHRIAGEVEAVVCELRRRHPGWGPRRLVHELERRGVTPVPSRATVYRVLVRNGLVEPGVRKRRRSDYRRWERSASMELWQMDIVGGLLLADGSECKMVTGIDDHSRFMVIAKVVQRATARAVCLAFGEALVRFGVPEVVLTDNGKQFTARFSPGKPGETMFDRICRENGIAHRLTRPQSPTTTGKIERFHQTLRRELLDQRDLGARPAGPSPLLPPPAEQIAERTVSSVGGFMVAGQRTQLGPGYAHQVVTAHLSEDAIRVFHSGELITTVPRVTRKEVIVRKSGEHNRRKIV
ncbi:IS481 family transposase [Streptomyces sp. DSM 118148]|uniref:IS481 family transposase n=1 Tax=Streptomyces sp. DSM 118148 TaxID=3448667 RepID=UPI0040403898